jgi:hypothetical protein
MAMIEIARIVAKRGSRQDVERNEGADNVQSAKMEARQGSEGWECKK